MNTLTRRSGVLLDVARLDYELAIRCATQRDLARVAGLPEVTISRGRHGRVRESTLRRITTALLEMPVLAGAELLIRKDPPRRKKTTAEGSRSSAVKQEVTHHHDRPAT